MTITRDFTEDEFLGGQITIRQSKVGFRAGLDSVLLAAAAKVFAGDQVLDAGSGAGVAGMCLLARVPDAHLLGVDVNPEAVRLCTENAIRNNLGDACLFNEGDVFDLPALVGRDRFDHVISNPPFHDPIRERISPHEGKAAAHTLLKERPYDEAIALWIKACLASLKAKGCITLVNRAVALPAMLAALNGPAGDIEVIPLWPKAGEPSRRVIIRARKGSRSVAKLHPGFVLHGEDGSFTPEIDAALGGCAPLIP